MYLLELQSLNQIVREIQHLKSFLIYSQIQSELDSYDSDIFQSKGSITNNNFDVYYRDITSRILKNINPNLIKDLSYYYTEDAVYRFIGRSVRDYLVTKIKGTL